MSAPSAAERSRMRDYSFRPTRPWHLYELIRTGAACAGVALQTTILLRVFGIV